MSTQNQNTMNNSTAITSLTLFQTTKNERVKKIAEKIYAVRRLSLLISFTEATLAAQLEQQCQLTKQLFNLSVDAVENEAIALQIVVEMQSTQAAIENNTTKIQALMRELRDEESALVNDLDPQLIAA